MYKKGKENTVADVLSQLLEEDKVISLGQLSEFISINIPMWLGQLKEENGANPWFTKIWEQMKEGSARLDFSIWDDLLLYKHRYCLSSTSNLRGLVMEGLHNSW